MRRFNWFLIAFVAFVVSPWLIMQGMFVGLDLFDGWAGQ